MVAIVALPLRFSPKGQRGTIDRCSRRAAGRPEQIVRPDVSGGGGIAEGEALAPRATWKGFLKIAEVTCPVALYAAATSSERIALRIVNRATGNRIHRQYIDEATGKPVEPEDQVKGYEAAKDEYVTLEPEDVAETLPQSDKTLEVSAFIDCKEIDEVYFDRPYYLGPADRSAAETFALDLRRPEASQRRRRSRAQILFRRVRTVLIRPYLTGLIASTLKFDYEVVSAQRRFRRRARDQGYRRSAGPGQTHH